MTDPINPQYGVPFDPNAGGGGGPNPDAGKDLSYLVPQLQVVWGTSPSFNLDPPNKNPSGGDDTSKHDAPPCGPIQVNLSTLRDAEQTMLGASRTVVGDYQALRDKVLAVKDTVFGQQVTVPPTAGSATSTVVGTGVWIPPDPGPSPIQDTAKKFAAEMNPAQEKALWQIANAIEIAGQYIAAVNRSGQSYGHADRASVFPDPPPNPVTNP